MKKSSLILGKVILTGCLMFTGSYLMAGNFIPVQTSCYKSMAGYPEPVEVGYSNNCILGDGFCVDNTCPEGTTEVQKDQSLPPNGGN
jgi:hypothetical protein